MESLRSRCCVIDAVVFAGCEPVEQPGVADAMAEVRDMGYLVGLHTSGQHPHRLAAVLPLLDWVGLDVSAANVEVWTSLELIMNSGVDYEVQLPINPAVDTREGVLAKAREVIRRGAHAPVLVGRAMYEVIHHEDLPDLERR